MALGRADTILDETDALAPIVPTGFTTPVAVALPVALDRLLSEVQPAKVILFGSYARGTARPSSDVDLLVILDETLPHADRYRLVGGALLPRLIPIDLIVLSRAELAAQLAAGNAFYREIIDTGRILHERPA